MINDDDKLARIIITMSLREPRYAEQQCFTKLFGFIKIIRLETVALDFPESSYNTTSCTRL